jgi:hypothetical protein
LADGNLKDCPATGLEHTAYLPHRQAVIRDVFENMIADDQIELGIRKLDAGDVHFGGGCILVSFRG